MNQQMQTVFEGYVNGRKFTDRRAMNQFIGECISSGVEISNMSYSQTTKPVCKGDCDHPCGGTKPAAIIKHPASWHKHLEKLNDIIPGPYSTVLGYIIPYVAEDIFFQSDADVDANQQDLEAKLTRRMEWTEANVLAFLRTGQYDTQEVKAWITSAIENLKRKIEWSNNRITQINKVLNAAMENRVDNKDNFIRSRMDTRTLEAYRDMYAQVSGYCSALSDILADTVA